MWIPYIALTQEYVSGAVEKITFDKFHVAKHPGNPVDRVRRREHKALVEQDCDGLKGTRYLWLRNPENLSPQRWADLKALRGRTLKRANPWAVKKWLCHSGGTRHAPGLARRRSSVFGGQS